MSYEERDLWIERTDPRDANATIKLYAVLRVPEGATVPLPAVICAHGFTACHEEADVYAIALAEAGFVSVAIDFFGGGARVRSDGTLLDMTIETEADDLRAFLDAVCALPEVDANRVGFLGCSQGGFVSTMVAARVPERVWGLALMYPAFVLHDDALRLFPDEADVPDTYCAFEGHEFSRVSRAYNLAARACDPYELMPRYAGPTLIVHGDADIVVPLRYSRKAQKTFPSARLEVNDAGTHGFADEPLKRALTWVTDFFGSLS
jgi:dienelactone hydrolase